MHEMRYCFGVCCFLHLICMCGGVQSDRALVATVKRALDDLDANVSKMVMVRDAERVSPPPPCAYTRVTHGNWGVSVCGCNLS